MSQVKSGASSQVSGSFPRSCDADDPALGPGVLGRLSLAVLAPSQCPSLALLRNGTVAEVILTGCDTFLDVVLEKVQGVSLLSGCFVWTVNMQV